MKKNDKREKIKGLFQDILTTPIEEQIRVKECQLQEKDDATYFKVVVSYKEHDFQAIIRENVDEFTVNSIVVYRKFASYFKPSEEMTQAPIVSTESIKLISLQSIENFKFDLQKFKAICDKMLHSEITFVECSPKGNIAQNW
jgi:hypothetical protein